MTQVVSQAARKHTVYKKIKRLCHFKEIRKSALDVKIEIVELAKLYSILVVLSDFYFFNDPIDAKILEVELFMLIYFLKQISFRC